ncbi:MAG: FAD-dependent oxidoreductase [Opitutus sp.]|nr:FAD-dependent oxidoreductase [Opitutus sp.]MCS6248747.1 FAD-dependent oxidoreductase [Opitutus sp.]MCS6278620.1 FAD-dependent oxidoreductase [Opitutus sp.]MCS6298491.1 FAD-dependent oxidoreductase [Opitutus sp.]
MNPDSEKMFETIIEASRSTSVVNRSDVLICGGGPAGIAAAIAAAREGARTSLIEVQGCLGGVWTAGALSWILDHENKPGIMAEILERLQAGGFRSRLADGTWTNAYDPEGMKSVLEEMCMEAGVHIRLHTRVVAAGVDETKRLTHVITESKSGREAWTAGMFVDATGDGDLAAAAGCGFDMGRDEDGHTQPMSLMALLTGLDADQVRVIRAFIGEVTRALAGKLPISVRAPLCVDVALRRKGDRSILHFVNRASGIPNQPNNGAIDEIPKVGPIVITMKTTKPPTSVSAAWEGSKPKWTHKGQTLTISLDTLHIHEAIVVL